MQAKIDDISYFKDMIEILVTKYNVDPERVYLTGWSNGSEMVMRLVCEMGDKIKAAAPFAGAMLSKKLKLDEVKGEPIKLDSDPTSLNYRWNRSYDEFRWDKQESYYQCDKAKNVNMLIINGVNDYFEYFDGIIFSSTVDPEVIILPPTRFAIWKFAIQNFGANKKPQSIPFRDLS